jgi:hypothetical protein
MVTLTDETSAAGRVIGLMLTNLDQGGFGETTSCDVAEVLPLTSVDATLLNDTGRNRSRVFVQVMILIRRNHYVALQKLLKECSTGRRQLGRDSWIICLSGTKTPYSSVTCRCCALCIDWPHVTSATPARQKFHRPFAFRQTPSREQTTA